MEIEEKGNIKNTPSSHKEELKASSEKFERYLKDYKKARKEHHFSEETLAKRRMKSELSMMDVIAQESSKTVRNQKKKLDKDLSLIDKNPSVENEEKLEHDFNGLKEALD